MVYFTCLQAGGYYLNEYFLLDTSQVTIINQININT